MRDKARNNGCCHTTAMFTPQISKFPQQKSRLLSGVEYRYYRAWNTQTGPDGSNRNVQLNVSTEEGNIEMWQAIRKEIIEMKTNPSVCTVSVQCTVTVQPVRGDTYNRIVPAMGVSVPPAVIRAARQTDGTLYFWLILQCSVTILWHDNYYEGENSNSLGHLLSTYWDFSKQINFLNVKVWGCKEIIWANTIQKCIPPIPKYHYCQLSNFTIFSSLNLRPDLRLQSPTPATLLSG